MAEPEKKAAEPEKKEEAPKTEKGETAKQTGAKIGLLTWIIMAVVVVVLAGSGFVLGRLFAHTPPSDASGSSQEKAPEEKSKAEKPKKEEAKGEKSKKEETKGEKKTGEKSGPESKDTWYYNDLEAVVVNPDEPGATRFVRIGVTLEMSAELTKEKAKEIIDAKKPPLINWLNLYFKSLTLSEMQNDRDVKRILSQICDSFNEILFPDAKPQIKGVLIREFNIQ
jgi:flagellar basal body-associated protein FliL